MDSEERTPRSRSERTQTRTATRRTVLRSTAAASATGLAGLAGCLGSSGLDELTVAYMPIYPDLQYFVMDGEGYFEEIDAEIDGREFTDGPAIVQAYGGGEIDVAMFGIVPSMIVVDRGLPAQVVAANIKEPMAIMADEPFHDHWADAETGSEAFAAWEATFDRPFRFGTFPQGSVPDALLRHWFETNDVDLESDPVEVIEIDGADAVWGAIANGEIDGTSIMEPVPTIAQAEDSSVQILELARDIMPGQPAAVTLMSDEVRDSPIGEQLLSQHVRATEFIDAKPDAAAGHASAGIGMPEDRARRALESPLSNFVTDPRTIEPGVEVFAELTHRNGQTDDRLAIEEIFDYEVYDGLDR